ncbi:hypothetical protein Anas_08715 [Armadillidium nasatum]|uniref:Uncharacterized protein n=1 Tax=Armadillidium nasatum TaxID=96803 RepID=A0A5N5TEQ5_9CRUS|nr:hypothetical protein Anas_08715 [Armadillidium nasatum]
MNKFFPGIGRIEYHPEAGPEDTLVYRHYDRQRDNRRKAHGRMVQICTIFFQHFQKTICLTKQSTLILIKRKLKYLGSEDNYGERSHLRPWDDGSFTLENYKRRILAAFEFFQKLNVKYYSVS